MSKKKQTAWERNLAYRDPETGKLLQSINPSPKLIVVHRRKSK